MKQVLENLRNGEISVDEIPTPLVKPGNVLVRNHYSLISAGTEGGTVKLGKMSLLGKAKARPEQAKKVLAVARTKGILTAYQAANRSLDMPIVLGYSCAGEVIAIGEGITDLAVGDKVACAGVGYANHAEIVTIPRKLCVNVPDELSLRYAAFTTLGAIALQGARIAKIRLGDNVVVIGLGLVGLLTVQLLRSAGCNVFGIDVDENQLSFVKNLGYCQVAHNDADNLVEQVMAFTSGHGADSVIITAATSDNGPVELAGKIARNKARVVAVGRTEMKAPRETYLFKELELCTSYAYGPGTGDENYEVKGIDYPIGYVRWTENRNMSAFIKLLSHSKLELEPLITQEFNIDEAESAFNTIINTNKPRPIAILLKYPLNQEFPDTKDLSIVQFKSTNKKIKKIKKTKVGISLIGAGSHATNELIPILQKLKNVEFRGISSATGVRASSLGKKYKFSFCTSDPEYILQDEKTDCVYILTRHDTHAALTISSLESGKHVFVEKPLALNYAELQSVIEAYQSTNLTLLAGFNRRYAPMANKMKNYFKSRAQPLSMHYRSNVGYRPPNHWLHDPLQGGGVILGEACHFIDFCYWFIESNINSVDVNALNGNDTGLISEDNVHITISFEDGSISTITYLSNGSTSHSRERIEVHCDNKTAVLVDFKRLELADGKTIKRSREWISADMGHLAQSKAFVSCILGEYVNEIDTEGYFVSSHATIMANDSLGSNNSSSAV